MMTPVPQTTIMKTLDKMLNEFLVEVSQEPLKSYPSSINNLVPEIIFNGVPFERKLVKRFNNFIKELIIKVAENQFDNVASNYSIRGVIKLGRAKRIVTVLNKLAHLPKESGLEPDWEQEITYIMSGRGEFIPITVVCDVCVENRQTGGRNAFLLDDSLSNRDGMKTNEKIFKLLCMEPPQVEGAYYVVPYNPYGRREDYRWSFPAR